MKTLVLLVLFLITHPKIHSEGDLLVQFIANEREILLLIILLTQGKHKICMIIIVFWDCTRFTNSQTKLISLYMRMLNIIFFL